MPVTPEDVAGKAARGRQSSHGRAPRALRTSGLRGAKGLRGIHVLVFAVVFLFTVIFLTASVFYLSGGRWFVVAAPSMGQTAPVGTFVLTAPVGAGRLLPGQIITFHPPAAPAQVYTHRIISNHKGVIQTRGDINSVSDPWTLDRSGIIGRAVAVVPGLGWLIRGLPYLVIGTVVLWVGTLRIVSLPNRAAVRITGLSLLVSIVAAVLKPFVGIAMLATFLEGGLTKATVVSTGLLPIRVQALGGTHVDLVDGMVGTVSAPSVGQVGGYSVATALHLPILGWVVLGLVCAAPLLWCLIVGLPASAAGESK